MLLIISQCPDSYFKLQPVMAKLTTPSLPSPNNPNSESTQYSSPDRTVSTRNRGKANCYIFALLIDPEPVTVTEDDEMEKCRISGSAKVGFSVTTCKDMGCFKECQNQNEIKDAVITRKDVIVVKQEGSWGSVECRNKLIGRMILMMSSEQSGMEAHYMYMHNFKRLLQTQLTPLWTNFDDEPMH
ncbi:hypothetical protein Tco_0951355 [Tanacetum coccineum]|uniref:Uncharacterized protein n=1 Tax=Tanacetum coccineum TaxID=301880 RepID=A0ABQ5DUA6_9ASTR